MRHWNLCALLTLSCLMGFGCDEDSDAPSQQAVEEAWKRADQAVKQSVASQADVKHIARLRDIDRLRYQAEVAQLSVQVTTLRGLAIGLSLALLAALIWLAVEIRRRRVLTAIIRMVRPMDSDPHPIKSPDAAAQPLIS